MLYKSSYNDITLLVRESNSQKIGHVAFWRFIRLKVKDSGYTNSQSQPTTYFRNTLEFARTVWIWTRVVCRHVQSLPAHWRHKSIWWIFCSHKGLNLVATQLPFDGKVK